MYRMFVSIIVVLWAAGAAAQSQPAPQLANPGLDQLHAAGGATTIERRPDGGQFGVCVFTDNYQCEEWALLRGEYPKNGLRVTGTSRQPGGTAPSPAGAIPSCRRPARRRNAAPAPFPMAIHAEAPRLLYGTCSADRSRQDAKQGGFQVIEAVGLVQDLRAGEGRRRDETAVAGRGGKARRGSSALRPPESSFDRRD